VVIHKKSGMFASRRIADNRPDRSDRPEKANIGGAGQQS
jgi:hypothetical protein